MALDPQLYRTPLLDKNGNMAREWIRFFDQFTNFGTWQEWNPQFSGWAGMTVSGVTIHDAQYFKQGSAVFFKMYAEMTLGGSPSNQIFITLPATMSGAGGVQVNGFTATVKTSTTASFSPGWGYCDPGGNLAKVLLAGEGNFPLGASAILINGFYRSI